MENRLVYEHPLNESIRNLLRIENLFKRLDYYSGSTDAVDMHLFISLLISLNDLLKWSDIKTELAKELERCQSVLRGLENNPGVDPYKLSRILEDINECVASLRDNSSQPGAVLDADELIASIKQKGSLAGGACNFDLPAYHYWLNLPLRDRQQRLREWQEDLLIVHKGADLVLDMIRNNAKSSKEVATGGIFQQSVEANATTRLIRVVTKRSLKCFPEVSGGKHRLTVRFLEQPDLKARPVQTEKDVEFALHFCV